MKTIIDVINLKKIILKIYYIIISIIIWIMPKVCRIHKNKIVICNFYGRGYGDSAKYIVEEIIRQNLEYDIVWLVDENKTETNYFPTQVRVVKYGSMKSMYELATAKIWIDNCRKKIYTSKRKKQFYIQTWHASMGLKMIEKDAQNTLSSRYIELAKKDSSMIDLMISGSEFRYNLYKNSFWYNGEILKCGTPRCDLFFMEHQHIKKKVYKLLSIESNKKIVLYAPTFREKSNTDMYKFNVTEILKNIEERFNGEWILLLRLHPHELRLAKLIEFNNSIINATNYDDMQELLAISDILITDYSSTMFDMAMQHKPCFLYAPDIDIYLKKERNLYFDINKLPFKISKSNEELKKNISEFNYEEYIDNVNIFNSKIKIFEDGFASKRVVEKIKFIIG